MNKKSFIFLLPPLILIGIVIIIVVLFLSAMPVNRSLSILDQEAILKQEFTTLWGSNTDEAVANTEGQIYDSNLFTGAGTISSYANNIQIVTVVGGTNSYVETKKVFRGEEVVVLVDSGYNPNGVCGFTNGILNPEQGHLLGVPTMMRYVPSTFDTAQYSVYRDGLKVKDINVGQGFKVGLKCSERVSVSFAYIGYKAEYACNLREDEVWMQEAYAQPFSVKDLSFPPVKYCDAERPFTLRSITLGEKKIRFEEGILPLNKGQTIPPRALTTGEFITINYATPNVIGVTNKCGIGEANIKVGSKWICQNIVPKAEVITRIVERREIIPITSGNSWTYSSHIKPSFNIGNKQFSSSVSYSCAVAEGEIIRPPNPASSCYKTSIKYDGREIILEDKQTANIEENIQVQFFADGQLTSSKNELSGTYIFNVIGKAVNVNSICGENLKLNQISYLNADITNYMPDGNVIIKTRQKVQNINLNLPEKQYTYPSKKGNNLIRVPVNTENLGLNSVELQVFYPINADAETLLSSDRIILNIDVSQEKSIIEFVEAVPPKKPQELGLFQKIINWLRNLLGL